MTSFIDQIRTQYQRLAVEAATLRTRQGRYVEMIEARSAQALADLSAE